MSLLVLIPLLGYILAWRRLTGSRSSSAALHASSAILLILYVAALGGQLLTATVLLLTCGVPLAIYELGSLLKRRKPMQTPLGVLVFLCAIFALLHNEASFFMYDEYAHWGIFMKEMLAGDALWGNDSNAMVLRYPPGAPLWQYFFLRFTAVTEGNAYLAQFCLLALPLLVLWEGLKWRQLYWSLSIFALVALVLSNFGHGFASLYVDHLLGAWFAGTIFNFLLDLEDRTPRQLLCYVLPIATIVLIKDAGLFFAAAAIGTMAFLMFWRIAFRAGASNIKSGLANASTLAVICIVGSGLVTISWNVNRDAEGIPPSTYSTRGIVAGITTGRSELSPTDQVELSRRFRQVVVHQQISKTEAFAEHGEFNYLIMSIFTDPFRLTTSSFILLFSLWQIVTVFRLADAEFRWRWAIAGTGLGLTAIVYIGILYLSYHFAFDERRMILPSYLRYVHSALLPMALFIFLPLLPAFSSKNERLIPLPGGKTTVRSAMIFALMLGALYVIETPYLEPLYKAHTSQDVRQQMKPYIDRVRNLAGANASAWIYLPVPDPNGMRRRIFLYDMSPVRTEVVTDPEFLSQNPAALKDVIANADILWFPIKDQQADEILRSLAGDDLKDYVFRIDRHDGKAEIIPLDGVFN